MYEFNYVKAKALEDVFKSTATTRFLGGGTTLIDLMKLEVETPNTVVDVNALPYSKIQMNKDGGAMIGALVRNSDLAHDANILKMYPVLSEALLAGASAQLRNKATTAGNLLQRTRCPYFRDTAMPCNKREPGSGCGAIKGFNRNLAILGTSDQCIASNPSDMNVALMALEAKIHIRNEKGERDVEMDDFYLLPGTTPHLEHALEPGDFITGVSLSALPSGARSLYLKLRDRASYEFALASAAIIVKIKNGHFDHVRIAMGGVGAKPWRARAAEKVLEGSAVSIENFAKAAEAELKAARPQSENAFKVELAKKCLVHALKQVTEI